MHFEVFKIAGCPPLFLDGQFPKLHLFRSGTFFLSIDLRNNLEATFGQIIGCFSRLLNKYARNPGASVGDRLEIYPWVASRLEEQPIISHVIRRTYLCPCGLPTVGSYGYSRMGHSRYLLMDDSRHHFSESTVWRRAHLRRFYFGTP